MVSLENEWKFFATRCNIKTPRSGTQSRVNICFNLMKFGWGGRIRTSEWRNQNPLHLVEADFVASAIVGCAVEASARNFC
jgi:hypothetical protein